MKTYIAIVRDHSASMKSLIKGAMDDFNLILDGIKDSTNPNDQTYLSVIECGVGHMAENRLIESSIPVQQVNKLLSYTASGSGTPLFDAVGMAIQNLESIKLHNSPYDNIAYLVMVITDGCENRSRLFTSASLGNYIRRLQATDKWSFVFRGPKGSAKQFQNIGVEPGNILEWEQTTESLVQSTTETTRGLTNYFATRSAGQTSTKSFYTTNIVVNNEDVRRAVKDSTNEFDVFNIPNVSDGIRIDEFVRGILGTYQVGYGYYQLTKPEKAVQDYKQMALYDKNTRKIYSGTINVRSLLGLPLSGTVKLIPGNHSNYEIFIQSTSTNRKLVGGSKMLYKRQ